MSDTNLPEFHTVDLGIAAFLLAQGIPLLGISAGDGWKRVFRFPARAQTLAQGYWGDAVVPARAFFNAIRDLNGGASFDAATFRRDRHRQRHGRCGQWAMTGRRARRRGRVVSASNPVARCARA